MKSEVRSRPTFPHGEMLMSDLLESRCMYPSPVPLNTACEWQTYGVFCVYLTYRASACVAEYRGHCPYQR